jgi:hypothetical protein
LNSRDYFVAPPETRENMTRIELSVEKIGEEKYRER